MFSLLKPAESKIRHWLAKAQNLPLSYGPAGFTESGSDFSHTPHGFVRDHTRSEIGRGKAQFQAAKYGFLAWAQFDLGWVRVVNAGTAIDPGQVVAVEAHTLGIWSVNISRILYVIDEETRFGFGYGTTPLHVERGEERFLLEFDPVSGAVHYDLLAISQPAHWLAKLGHPYARSQQRRFARESHRRMRNLLSGT